MTVDLNLGEILRKKKVIPLLWLLLMLIRGWMDKLKVMHTRTLI